MEQRIKICPECGQEIRFGRFVSRKDNKTPICGLCYFVEALHELEGWQRAAQQSIKQTKWN